MADNKDIQPDRTDGAKPPPQSPDAPDGFPESPDLAKVAALRHKLKMQRAGSGHHHRTGLHDRLERDSGRSVRDVGTYTLIPMMMVAGPAMGFLVGRFVEGRFGGEPWLGVGGVMFGLVAAVRQIVLMLARKNHSPGEKGP